MKQSSRENFMGFMFSMLIGSLGFSTKNDKEDINQCFYLASWVVPGRMFPAAPLCSPGRISIFKCSISCRTPHSAMLTILMGAISNAGLTYTNTANNVCLTP